MKFIVKRTSIWNGSIKPCKEAKKTKDIKFMDCTCKTITEALKHTWVQKGYPVQMKGFVRVYDKKESSVYYVEINSLDELILFKSKYGDIIIKDSDYQNITNELEIYDNYRE